MPDYGKMTQEEFDAILAEILDEQPASHLLGVAGVYEAVAECYNNDVLNKWAENHPTRYHIRSDRFSSAVPSEPVTMEEFEKLCEDNGWDEPELRCTVLRDARREVYHDAQTGELVLEEEG